ncbi:MAG: DUF1877 family protein [Gemmatimonadales bacterium]
MRLQHYSQVSPKQASDLRADPSALADFLKSPKVYRNCLGMYWHAVPYLLTGVVKDQDEPYCFFMKGGEIIGRNDAGDVRYLSPEQVASLARALKEEPPNELGLGMYDEAGMDRHGIYPARWGPVRRPRPPQHHARAVQLPPRHGRGDQEEEAGVGDSPRE